MLRLQDRFKGWYSKWAGTEHKNAHIEKSCLTVLTVFVKWIVKPLDEELCRGMRKLDR